MFIKKVKILIKTKHFILTLNNKTLLYINRFNLILSKEFFMFFLYSLKKNLIKHLLFLAKENNLPKTKPEYINLILYKLFCKSVSTFSSSCVYNSSSTICSHPSSKSMLLFHSPNIWLISSFHLT